jgi:hypothetical protein
MRSSIPEYMAIKNLPPNSGEGEQRETIHSSIFDKPFRII